MAAENSPLEQSRGAERETICYEEVTAANAQPINSTKASMRFTRMVALGRSCQCPHQVRRFTKNKSAAYFDYLGTPLKGLVEVLKRNFVDCFDRESLVVSQDGLTVHHRVLQLSYRHLFSRIEGTERVDPEAVDREFPEKRERMAYLARKWFEEVRKERILFVRHDDLSREDALLLYETLRRHSEEGRYALLVIMPPGESWESNHPAIFCESGIPPSGPNNWKGNNDLWNRVLEKYWNAEAMEAPTTIPSLQKNAVKKRTPAEPPVIAFQVPNEIGLGHMNRMACVAWAVRELDPEIRSVFVVEGSSHGVLEAFSLPYVIIPTLKSFRRNGSWAQWPKHECSGLLNSMVSSVVNELAPDLVVYDCFPSLAFVTAAARLGIPSVLCLRKMKDYEAYMQESRVQAVLRACQSILIPHTEEEAALPDALKFRAVYTGVIVKPLPINPTPIQLRLALPGNRVLVVTAGGGGHTDTPAFLALALKGAERLRATFEDLTILLIPGPLFQAWDKLSIPAGTYLLPFDPQLVETCATADLVIAQAGYNSAHELALLGTPTIMVPAERGFDDQFERATALGSAWPNIHALSDASPARIAELGEGILRHPPERLRHQAPEGAFLAAAHLLHTLRRL